MKKFLAVLLAAICVFSMATVAFAGDLTNKCDVCGYESNDIADFTAHKNAKACGVCSHCNNASYKNEEERIAHTYICDFASIVCDYCGKTFTSEEKFDNHIADCKAKYFNIPLAKIIATVKDLISKIDFGAIVGTIKDKVVPAITGLVGKIDFSAIKLPA